jgi:anti-sigma B factor antagonist
MSLALHHRQVGEVTVVSCRGRLVAGDESAAFQQHVDRLLAMSPRLVLHLAAVDFVDSAGLGVLVRYFIRAQNAQGGLTIAAVSPRVAEVLRVTRLDGVLQPYATEADAIAAAHQPGAPHDASFASPQVLCVDTSPDLLAYLREVLKESGYGTLTAGNLADAAILLRAVRPAVVVIGPGLGDMSGSSASQEFRRLTDGRAIVELPSDFGALDAATAAEQVLAAVRARVPTA